MKYILVCKCTELHKPGSSSQGLSDCTVVALVYGNEAPTGRPDEMDFPSVDTSDCVVTVELRECGLIILQRPLFGGTVIETLLGSVGYDERQALCEMSGRYDFIRHD